MNNGINLGIIGVGRIGAMHARNLKNQIPGVNVLAVSDIIEENAQKVAAELDIPVAEKDYQRLLDNSMLDAVVICSSTDTHARIIQEAAEAGKDIFCEKPIAFEMDKIDRALEAVENAGVKLMVGFNRRFDPSFKKAREMVRQGEIGRPHLVRITSRDPEPPPLGYIKVSGGLFVDMMIHDFDMARYLMGDEIEELMAYGGCLVDPAIEEVGDIDTAVVSLKYRNGAFGTIDNSRKAVYGYDQRIEVFGSEGCIIVGNKRPTEVVLKDSGAVKSDKHLFFFIERYQEAYLQEMLHFADCIKNNLQPEAAGIDGKMSVVVADAARDSLLKGGPVRL